MRALLGTLDSTSRATSYMMGALAGFLILSYYAVIAGWAMAYVVELGTGTFVGADADKAIDAVRQKLAG